MNLLGCYWQKDWLGANMLSNQVRNLIRSSTKKGYCAMYGYYPFSLNAILQVWLPTTCLCSRTFYKSCKLDARSRTFHSMWYSLSIIISWQICKQLAWNFMTVWLAIKIVLQLIWQLLAKQMHISYFKYAFLKNLWLTLSKSIRSYPICWHH